MRVRNILVVPDHFGNHEIQELLGEFRIQVGFMRQGAQAFDLRFLPVGVARWQLVLGFEVSYALGRLEALGQEEDQLGIEVVDAAADGVQLLKHFILDLTVQRAGVRVE